MGLGSRRKTGNPLRTRYGSRELLSSSFDIRAGVNDKMLIKGYATRQNKVRFINVLLNRHMIEKGRGRKPDLLWKSVCGSSRGCEYLPGLSESRTD